MRRQLVGIRDDWESVFRAVIEGLPLNTEDDQKYFRLVLLGAMNYSHVWFRKRRENARKVMELIRYGLFDEALAATF